MITAPIKPEISNSHHFSESSYFTIPTATEKKYRQINAPKVVPTDRYFSAPQPLRLSDTKFALSDLIFSDDQEIKMLLLVEQGVITPRLKEEEIERLIDDFKTDEIREFSLDSLLSWAKEVNKEDLHLVCGLAAIKLASFHPEAVNFKAVQISFITERVINIEKETKAIAFFEEIYGKDIT